MTRDGRELGVAGGRGRELTEVQKLARSFVWHRHTKRSLEWGVVLNASTTVLWVVGALILVGSSSWPMILGMALGAVVFAVRAMSNVIVLGTLDEDASKSSRSVGDS